MTKTIEFHLIPNDTDRLINLCGVGNENITCIEQLFSVSLYMRGSAIRLCGKLAHIKSAKQKLLTLYEKTLIQTITTDDIQKLSVSAKANSKDISTQKNTPTMNPSLNHMPQSITPAQANYIQNIRKHPINFVVGPAGSGKTYIAVTYGVSALISEEFDRLVVVRPAVEAGEHLGFLPGQLNEKIDPYLRPIYDVIDETLSKKTINTLLKQERIQAIPLAFMRGQTLKNAFVILDEAQNTTPAQMKMFLTRLGQNTKMIITGDITQNDLQTNELSGLVDALKRLKNIGQIPINELSTDDIVRHPLIKEILKYY